MTADTISYEAFEIALDQVFRSATSAGPRYILVSGGQLKLLRRYLPRPNRCVRTFKLRKLRRIR